MTDRIANNIEAGSAVVAILRSRIWTDHAATMHAEVMEALDREGFWVEAEVAMPYNRRRGRIDIVAEYAGSGSVAIELDCRTPRRKSIAKLIQFPGYRIIGIRGIEGHREAGIDACVPMRVHFASRAVKADRRIYRPAPVWSQDWKGVS